MALLRRHMASGATAVQLGGASASRTSLSGADAALLVLLQLRKGAPVALPHASQSPRPAEGDVRDGACAVGAVLQSPALLAVMFAFLEPADLCTVALVCDAWSLVRRRARDRSGLHTHCAATGARALCWQGWCIGGPCRQGKKLSL